MTHIATGRCTCGDVRYGLTEAPLIVHCCHCTWCQRETGTGFALNGVIERTCVERLEGKPTTVPLPSESGKGQIFARCPTCQVALWSVYSGMGAKFLFIRLGTLENPAQFAPDVHIYTSTKLPWITLPEDVPCFEAYYRRSQVWSETSLARRDAALAAPE